MLEAKQHEEKKPHSDHDPIPAPENGSHERSHAAHLGNVHDHTKPAGDLRQLEAERERQMEITHAGGQPTRR